MFGLDTVCGGVSDKMITTWGEVEVRKYFGGD